MTSPAVDPAAPLVIVNPRASLLADPERRTRVVGAVAEAVRTRTGQAPVIVSGTHDEALAALEAIAASAADEPSPALVVAVGGDGTVRDAAAALLGRGIPLAIVPGGTGNVLAGTLGIRGPATAVRSIARGQPRTIDLGEVRTGLAGTTEATPWEVFIVACGMGLDARIMAAAQHEWKRRLRFGAYIGAAIGELAKLRAARYRIVADGEVIEMDAYVGLVANAGDLVPGRLGPRRPVDPSDGWLDLIVVGGRNRLTGLLGAADVLLRRGDLDGRVVRRCVRQVRLEADPPEPIESDGDERPAGWLEARVRPDALMILGAVD